MTDDILDILVAHGVPGATIVQVAKLIADAQQNQERRAKNTERMRAVRTHAHTGVHTETQDAAFLSKEGKISPKEEIKKETKKESRQKAKTALPPEWQPIGSQRDPAEAEEFRDHARAKGYRYSDWHAAYRNYQRSPYNARNKNGSQPPDDQAERERQEYFAMQERQREVVNRMTAQGASREEIKRACWSEAVTGKPDANGKSH